MGTHKRSMASGSLDMIYVCLECEQLVGEDEREQHAETHENPEEVGFYLIRDDTAPICE